MTNLRKFGISLSVPLCIIGVLQFLFGRLVLSGIIICAGIFVSLVAFIRPSVLRPVQFVLDIFLKSAQWIITRLVLMVVFYLVITPFGLMLRLLQKNLLDPKIDKSKETYWRSAEGSHDYENQF